MKQITVLTFGAIKEMVGESPVVLTDVATTEALREKLETTYPALRKMRYAIAVNKQVVTAPTKLEDDSTVALLPPFSGG